MLLKRRTIASVVLIAAAMLGPIYAQRFGRFFMRQNEPPPDSEFILRVGSTAPEAGDGVMIIPTPKNTLIKS